MVFRTNTAVLVTLLAAMVMSCNDNNDSSPDAGGNNDASTDTGTAVDAI